VPDLPPVAPTPPVAFAPPEPTSVPFRDTSAVHPTRQSAPNATLETRDGNEGSRAGAVR
jgi:hypothetical protein